MEKYRKMAADYIMAATIFPYRRYNVNPIPVLLIVG